MHYNADTSPGLSRLSGAMRKGSHDESHENYLEYLKKRGIPIERYLPTPGRKTNIGDPSKTRRN